MVLSSCCHHANRQSQPFLSISLLNLRYLEEARHRTRLAITRTGSVDCRDLPTH